jgi:hypothetical protein
MLLFILQKTCCQATYEVLTAALLEIASLPECDAMSFGKHFLIRPVAQRHVPQGLHHQTSSRSSTKIFHNEQIDYTVVSKLKKSNIYGTQTRNE